MEEFKNLKIKKAFLYNDDLYRKLNVKFFIKKIIIILVFGLIIYCSFKYYLSLDFSSASNEKLFGGVVIIFVAIISAFFIMYHFLSLVLFSMDDALFANRCYIITEDNRFLTVKFENAYYVRTPTSNGNILSNIVRLIFIKAGTTLQKEQLKMNIEDILKMNKIMICMEVKNVYKIKQKRNYVDMKCDCHNLLTNEFLPETEISIYKYFDNWEEIILFVNQNLKNKSYDINKYKNMKKYSLDKYEEAIINQLPRLGYFFPIIFNFSYLFESGFDETMIPISLSIGLPFLLISLFYEKKFLNEIDNEEINNFLDKKLKKDRVITILYLSVIFIFMIIFHKYFVEMFAALLISFLLTTIVILKIKKK